jgi:hypothetical protein
VEPLRPRTHQNGRGPVRYSDLPASTMRDGEREFPARGGVKSPTLPGHPLHSLLRHLQHLAVKRPVTGRASAMTKGGTPIENVGSEAKKSFIINKSALELPKPKPFEAIGTQPRSAISRLDCRFLPVGAIALSSASLKKCGKRSQEVQSNQQVDFEDLRRGTHRIQAVELIGECLDRLFSDCEHP